MLSVGHSPPRTGRADARGLRLAILLGAGVLALQSFAPTGSASASEKVSVVAVFPVENLSGRGAPADEIRNVLIDTLTSSGVRVLDDDTLDDFIVRHRIRYAAGIDAATANALREETGADAVLIASVDLSSDEVPPKVGLMARLVSVQAAPVIVWADDVGLAGDDAPGWLELGIVNDYPVLLARGLNLLSDSLREYLRTGQRRAAAKSASKFRPKSSYRRLALDPGRTYSVAVLPFVNLSEHPHAGEILALLFVRHMSGLQNFRVAEVGEIRTRLLEARIIMDGGVSVADAENVASRLSADFVLGGRVIVYEDQQGSGGRTRVEFSTVLIESRSGQVVWSSDSYNDGTDGVYFFERGTTRTAHALATQMGTLVAGMIAGSVK